MVGRLIDVDGIVGATEVASRLGYAHRQHVHWLRRDPTFPAPVADVGSGRRAVHVWYWPDIEAWRTLKGRSPAHPEGGSHGDSDPDTG